VSKVLSGISKIAGAIAAVAVFIPGIGPIISAVAGAVSMVSGVLATITAKPPSRAGVSNSFIIDPQAGIPYVIGRTRTGGKVVHRRGYGGSDNPYYSYITVLSGGGPIDAIEQIQMNSTAVTFDGTKNAVGYYRNWMWFAGQTGAAPEGGVLPQPFAGFPSWGPAYKLSGYAAFCLTTKFDKNGKIYGSGTPDPSVILRGVKVYDPRLDSTYPGGSGPCRALNEATYVYSANGPLHGVTWLLGRWQNGKKALGVGVPVAEIDMAAFVDAANTWDLNGWQVGAELDGSGDKWNNLKLMLQAGASEPMDLGGIISCFCERPRPSLATIGPNDLAAGSLQFPIMRTYRDRINGVIPRYRSGDHNWEIVPANVVRSTTALAEDGEERTREQEYFCCQSVTQAVQLAAYEISRGRESEGIVLPLKLEWIGYRPGDCLTINLPEDGIVNLKVVVVRRTLDPATGTVTMVFRTETDAKHGYALGQAGTAPPSAPVIDPADSDAIVAANIQRVSSSLQSSIRLASIVNAGASPLSAIDQGVDVKINISAHEWDYPAPIPNTMRVAGSFTGLSYTTTYYVSFDDDTLANTAPAYLLTTTYDDARNTDAHPARHYLGQITTPKGGGAGTGGSGGGSNQSPRP
jgi:hypothetical protein